MTINEARLHDAPSLMAAEPLLIDRGALFLQRTAIVAATAAADADDVDRKARFPKTALDAARREKLLGMQIPQIFGGHGTSIHDLTEVWPIAFAASRRAISTGCSRSGCANMSASARRTTSRRAARWMERAQGIARNLGLGFRVDQACDPAASAR
jgi:alkylation response protein AidB-like acyl-CoA dehydrogenase